MQIILVSTRFSTAKTIHIMPRHGVMALCGFFFLVFSTSALFSWLSVELRLPLVQDLVVSLYKRETQQSQD
ncbi:MAG: hypothetical protein RIR00_1247, partial [Pseudomonadota bacterium]